MGMLDFDLSSLEGIDWSPVSEAMVSVEKKPWLEHPPTPIQLAFHMDQSRLRAIIAANQVGKTRTASIEMNWLSTGTHPYWPDIRQKGCGLIVVGVWGLPYIELSKKIYETIDKDTVDWSLSRYDEKKGWGGHSSVGLPCFVRKDGFITYFTSTRSGSTSAASLSADWVWVDEPPKEGTMDEILARVSSTNGPIIFTFTPWDSQQDLRWLQLYLEGDPSEGRPPTCPGWSIHRIAYTPENVPWRSRKQVEEQANLYTALTHAQRVLGLWGGMAVDRIMQDYSDACLIDSWAPPEDEAWWYLIGGDHGEGAGKEAMLLIAWKYAEDSNVAEEIVFLDEYVNDRPTTPEEDAEGILEMLERNGLTIDDIDRMVCDTNSLGKQAAGYTINEALGEILGFDIDKPNKRPGQIDLGARLINQKFRKKQAKIVKRCKNFIASCERWKGKDDAYKHMIDAARYPLTPLLIGEANTESLETP